MTREEEIDKAWFKKAVRSDYQYDERSFREAIDWADKHPKRYNQDELCNIQLEMMRQRDKRFIARALSWLRENIEHFVEVKQSLHSAYEEFHLTENFDKEFIKAMENGK